MFKQLGLFLFRSHSKYRPLFSLSRIRTLVSQLSQFLWLVCGLTLVWACSVVVNAAEFEVETAVDHDLNHIDRVSRNLAYVLERVGGSDYISIEVRPFNSRKENLGTIWVGEKRHVEVEKLFLRSYNGEDLILILESDRATEELARMAVYDTSAELRYEVTEGFNIKGEFLVSVSPEGHYFSILVDDKLYLYDVNLTKLAEHHVESTLQDPFKLVLSHQGTSVMIIDEVTEFYLNLSSGDETSGPYCTFSPYSSSVDYSRQAFQYKAYEDKADHYVFQYAEGKYCLVNASVGKSEILEYYDKGRPNFDTYVLEDRIYLVGWSGVEVLDVRSGELLADFNVFEHEYGPVNRALEYGLNMRHQFDTEQRKVFLGYWGLRRYFEITFLE